MSIIIDENTAVLVQGITGKQGLFHTAQMMEYGTRIVCGVTPGKSGTVALGCVPVYDTVREACENHTIDASILFVPAQAAKDAALEAMDSGIGVVVVITEHIPVHDALKMVGYARRTGTTLVGPNTFGLVSPGKSKIGIPSGHLFKKGPVGIVARSGTLTYEITAQLSESGIGQSSVVGVGGDPVVGLNFTDVLMKFENDPQTEIVILIGEIGGSAEEDACPFIKSMTKPVVAYVAGKTAPPGKRMGHAGAIIERGKGGYEQKVVALRDAGVHVAALPLEVSGMVSSLLKRS